MVDFVETVLIPIKQIRPNEWNPNVMNADLFNELTSNIETAGFVQDVVVAPLPPEEAELTGFLYRIVDGEHRFDALTLLMDSEDSIPCKIVGLTEDEQKFQTVKLNRLRGKFDQKRFTALVRELMERYSFEEVAERMAFTDPTELEAMMSHARESLPDEMKEDFDRAKGDIKTVDDLSMVLNRLFTKYGDTLPYHFMILDFGGKEHLWVRMEPREYRAAQAHARECMAHGLTFDSVIARLMTVLPLEAFIRQHHDFLQEVEVEDASHGVVRELDG